MTFAETLPHLIKNGRIRRKSWPKLDCLEKCRRFSYLDSRGKVNNCASGTDTNMIIYTQNGKLGNLWYPSQADILATDWEVS